MSCENGHEIARLRRDLSRGDRLRSDCFEPLRADVNFLPHAKVQPCPECQGHYIRQSFLVGGLQIHIAGAWRP